MIKKKPIKPAYSQEFKETAIKLALVGDKSIAEVARELGISDRALYGWLKAWKKKNGYNTPGSGKSSPEEDLRKLQKRYRELELENEILKKAAAYFAKTLL
jgi:transposase